MFGGIVQDVRCGVRVLKRTPVWTTTAILTIALGISATTTVFGLVSAVALKPLPWPDAGRLVRIVEYRQGRPGRLPWTVSNGTYLAWADHPATLEGIGGWRNQPMTMSAAGEAVRLRVTWVTPSVFAVLKVSPVLGRAFAADEGRTGQPGAIVLGYGLWQERFGGRADAVGQVVQLDGQPHTVVGVMPRHFAFPDRDGRAWIAWSVPTVVVEQAGRTSTRMVILSAIARLRPGVTVSQATAEATARGRAAPDAGVSALALFGAKGPIDVSVQPALDVMTAEVRPAIRLLLVAVTLLLIAATASVASLLLAHSSRRQRELAVRAALGAGTGRLIRQLLVESSLIASAGGAAGLLLAVGLMRALTASLPADFPRLESVALDRDVLAFAIAISIATALLAGVIPAWRVRRFGIADGLLQNAASMTVARTGTGKVCASIVIAQIAVSCALLVGAVLLTRSFLGVVHADRGYDPAGLLTAELPFPRRYPAMRRLQLTDTLLERLRQMPGVADAAVANALPLVSPGDASAFTMRSPGDPGTIEVHAVERVVSPAYFSALRLRILQGRALLETDTEQLRPVVVVNRTFAARYLGQEPLGQQIPAPFPTEHRQWEVVGIVDDMRQDDVAARAQPEVFASYRQVPIDKMRVSSPVFILRTTGEPAQFAPMFREILRQQDASLALDSVLTMDERIANSLARPRTYAVVLSAFAIGALAIAAVGLFGVVSFGVAQRSRELAVRAALGACRHDLVAIVLKQAVAVAALGIALGLWAAWVMGTLLAEFLYGVKAHDALTFAGVTLAILTMTLAACAVPAWRAARLDPSHVLRLEP